MPGPGLHGGKAMPRSALKRLPGLLLFAASAVQANSDVAVVRVGDGAAPLDSSATVVFVERRSGGDGSLVQDGNNPLALPTAASGANARLTLSGSGTSEGAIARSADARYLTLGGYDAAVGTMTVSSTASSTVNRVAARIDSIGNIDTSTRLNSAFSAGSVRSAVSADGAEFWLGGAGTGGCWYVTLGALGGTQIISASPTNTRVMNTFGGQLYGSSASGTFVNVFAIGSGLPTTSGQPATSLAGMPTSGSSPYAFVFFDRSNLVAGLDTLYVADDRSTASGGGIQKWVYDSGMGVWALSATFTGAGSVRGLAGEVSGANVVLYATTTLAPSTLVRVVDDGSLSPSAVVLATAATDTVFRGVALWPDVIFVDNFE